MLCSLGMTLAPSNAAARSLGPGTYANPVCNQWDCADPTVERGPDGRFYLVSSGGWGKQSVDMVNWTDGYGKMESMPTWNGYEGLWAPDVTRIGDKYVMYYAHSQWMGDLWDKCGVGVAISDNIAGPYKDLGKLFTSREIGVYNSIDPNLFIEDDGRLFLAWGSYWGGLYIIELSSDGLSIKPGAQKVQLTAPDFEGCMLHKHNGYYYLFASCGTCCEENKSTYTTVVGRATSLFGPYYDRAGGRMLDGKYHVVISNNRYFKGTGHNAEINTDDAGNDWIYYHAYEEKSPGIGRILMMDRVRWEDDWPVINNGFPADCQVPAPYIRDYAADPAITAPRLCWHDGYYYLFGQAQQASSSGKTTTNIVVGRSATITGPYVDGMGNRLLDGYFHTVMAGNAYFYDPSNLSPILTDDAGDEWVIYNAVQASASHTYPVMLLDRVRWQDGWPRISDGYPSYYPTRAPLIR